MANLRPNNLKVWPHLALVFLGFAALGAVAAALWMRHEPKAQALAVPRAARVERVEGEVGLGRGLDDADDADAEGRWVALTPNTPLTEGDRLYAREDARASLAFTGRNRARIDEGSALDVVSLSDRRTQLALRDGSAVFDIGHLAPGEVFEVATPYGAVDLREPGLYEVGYNDDGSAFVSVLSGLAQVVGLAGSGEISKGEMLTLLGQTAAQVALSRLNPEDAGGLLDDYYGYQYPDAYDGRYGDYDAYLNDPDYYDPYNRDASYRYVPEQVPGAYDLDRHGDWQELGGYGHAWSPRVESDWAPYRDGRWMLDDPYGPTWVSNEPWGYAPYHYGRWVNEGGRWYWVPDARDAQPAYAPALVAFLPQAGSELIGWAPLAPGEPYAPAYYDANWQPHYVGGEPAFPERLVNLGAPGGLTAVPAENFYDLVGRDRVARFDPRTFDGVRPSRDPLSHAALRQLSLTHAAERRGFAMPPGLARKLRERQVYASAPQQQQASPLREDFARRLGVAALPEKQKKEKLQFKDERELSRQGKAEARDARRSEARGEQRRQLDARREQRRQEFPQAERVAAGGEERARGERGGGQARREQRESERQQQHAAAEQHRSSMRPQAEARRQGRQQAAAERAPQQQEMRSRQSQPRGRGAERQQQQQARPAAQSPQGHGRGGQRHAQQQQQKGGGRPSGGPPQAKQQGGGGGKGGGKGKGKN